MSTKIVPDFYRHIARKSTISKNIESSSKSATFNMDSTTKIAMNNKVAVHADKFCHEW